jgi:ABC-2 type transport system ATP-binding protein
MMLGLIYPTSGHATLLGAPMPRGLSTSLPRVGAVIEGPGFYPFLSGLDNLMRMAVSGPKVAKSHAGRRQAALDALERVGLSQAAHRQFRRFSLGMKQRLALAAALMRPVDLLILDEPTNGLDPQGMREVRGIIQRVPEDGTTVFISSHLLGEVEQICTHAAIVARGRMVRQGSLAELLDRPAAIVVETPDVDLALATLASLTPAATTTKGPEAIRMELNGMPAEEYNQILVQAGVRVRALKREETGLEDRFVELTGEGFNVG